MGGLSGFVVEVVDRLGELGIGLLTFAETVFPPIPSEVILPLGGYLAERGRLNWALVLLLATVGSVLGAWTLYWIAAKLGVHRSAALFDRLPLVEAQDVHRSVAWFERHGDWAVFLGRLMPGVRSLVSIPAGAARMNPVRFTLLTIAGSGLWNGLLIGGGMLAGTQWQTVEKYSHVLDYVLYAAIAAVLVWLVVRRVRRGSGDREPAHS